MKKAYPRPPEHFDLTPKLAASKGTRLFYRFNPVGYSSCLYFSKKKEYRFDDPDKGFGVFYAAVQPDAAFAESYGHDVSNVPNNANKVVSEQELEQRHVFVVGIKALRLAMFCGEGLPFLNLDGNICTMADYEIPQQWAKWTHQHPQHYDGILYHARHLPSVECIALFERANSKVVNENDLGSALAFQHPRTGKTIFDILAAQGWAVFN